MAKIYFYRLPEWWTKEEKYQFLQEKGSIANIDWQEIISDKNHTWLTAGLNVEFESFIPLGAKAEKASKKEVEGVIFKTYGRGVGTSRDAWAYNFNRETLATNMQRTIETYNEQVNKWIDKEPTIQWANAADKRQQLDALVLYDDSKLSWSHTLKTSLERKQKARFSEDKIRLSRYRPFTKNYLFFDRVMNNEGAMFWSSFPTPATETENRVICVNGVGSEKAFSPIISHQITDLAFYGGGTACVPKEVTQK